MLHKNVNFWIRLFYRLLDIITFFSLVTLLSFLSVFKTHNPKQIPLLSYYYFWIASVLISLILFIIIPFVFEGRTIWMIIFRVQILLTIDSKTYMNKAKIHKAYLLRSLFSFWIWLFLVLLIMSLIMPWQINKFYEYLLSKKSTNEPFNFVFLTRFIQTVIGLYFTFLFIDTLVIIVNKKNLGIIDNISGTRVTWIKHYNNNQKTMPKLIPFKADNKSFTIIS